MSSTENESLSAPGVLRSYVSTLLNGWWSVARSVAESISTQFARLSLFEVLFLLASLGVAFTSLWPWIAYDVNLIEPETAGRGSSYRMLFFLPGALGVFLYCLGGKYRHILYLASAGLIAALYLAGLAFPNPIHTDMSRPADYHLEPVLFVYFACLVVALLTSMRALRKPLVSFELLREALCETQHPTEPLNPTPDNKRRL